MAGLGDAVAVADIPGRGRGLIAARDIREGEVVLQDWPVLAVPSAEMRHAVCGACLRMCDPGSGAGATCTGCGQQAFCSESCRSSADAPGAHHSVVCSGYRSMSDIQGMTIDDKEALTVLIHAQSLRLAAENGDEQARHKYQAILATCGDGSGRDALDSGAMHAALQACMPGVPVMPLPEMRAVLDKDAMNSYAFLAPVAPNSGAQERRVRGSAVFPVACLANHECTPNVARVDNPDATGLAMPLVALRDIPAGQELQLSYVPLHWPLTDRRERLEQEYGFTCQCDRCQTEELWGGEEPRLDSEMDWAVHIFLTRYVCPGCGGTMVPVGVGAAGGVQCNVCWEKRGKDDWMREIEG